VTPRYFETMGIPLLAGRALSEADTATSPPVVVISQSMAERYWPGQNPIGRRVKRGRAASALPWMEVVGVVGNLRENAEADIPANDAWYLPYGQPTAGPIGELTYVIKTRQGQSLISPARDVVARVDSDLPIFDPLTMEERFARFTATERLTVSLTAILATLGIFLAAVGVYAVLAFSVRRRWPELGIRAALGAGPGDIRGTVIGEATRFLAAGLGVGSIVALLVRPWFDANLFPTGISEPAAAAAAAASVALATAIAAIVPAARASRLDPIRAMSER